VAQGPSIPKCSEVGPCDANKSNIICANEAQLCASVTGASWSKDPKLLHQVNSVSLRVEEIKEVSSLSAMSCLKLLCVAFQAHLIFIAAQLQAFRVSMELRQLKAQIGI